MSTEIWKDIKGYEGHYMVSNIGRIKSVKKFKNGKVRDSVIHIRRNISSGYMCVRLKRDGIAKGFDIHRLVAVSFLDTVDGKNVVNHLNGVKHDNRAINLEFVNKSENMIYSIKHHGVKRNGSENPNSRYTEAEIKELRTLHKTGETIYACAKITGIKQRTAYAILNNQIRKNT